MFNFIKPEKQFSAKEMMALLNDGKILSESGYGPKVIQQDNLIYKIFYRRKLISKKIFFCKAKYFIAHSRALAKRQISTVKVQNYYYCKEMRADIVVYESLPGQSIYDHLKAGQLSVMSDLAKFLGELHSKGVFFRAIHIGNILLNDHEMALLDIDNVRFSRRRLSLNTITRNFRHLINHRDDKALFKQFGIDKFLKEYFAHSFLKADQQKKLSSKLLAL